MKTKLFIVLLLLIIIRIESAESTTSVSEMVKSIDGRVALIEAYKQQHPDKLQFFGVQRALRSPDRTEANVYEMINSPTDGFDGNGIYYKILRDNKGRILYYYEEPDDGSGDWSQYEEYYFDDNGNTIMYENYDAAFFQDECKYIPTGGIVKTIIKEYFDKDASHINEVILTLREQEPFDLKLCGIDTKFPIDKIARNYKALNKAAQKKYSKYKWNKLWN